MSIQFMTGSHKTMFDVASIGCCYKGCQNKRDVTHTKKYDYVSRFCSQAHQDKCAKYFKKNRIPVFLRFFNYPLTKKRKVVKLNGQMKIISSLPTMDFDKHCKMLYPNFGK